MKRLFMHVIELRDTPTALNKSATPFYPRLFVGAIKGCGKFFRPIRMGDHVEENGRREMNGVRQGG
jgi:hypothetical protein